MVGLSQVMGFPGGILSAVMGYSVLFPSRLKEMGWDGGLSQAMDFLLVGILFHCFCAF